jgi:hypothetical protein
MPFFQELEIIRDDVNSRNTSGSFRRAIDGRTTNLGKSQYNVNTLQFPLDIGSADKGHYLMFNINAQKKTQFATSDDITTDPTIIANMKKLQAQRGGSTNIINQDVNNILGTTIGSIVPPVILGVSNLTPGFSQFGAGLASGFANFGNDLKNVKSSEFLRTIKRITDTVVLYMPDKITYSNAQNYGEIPLGGEVKSLAGLSAAATTAQSEEPGNLATFAAFLGAELSPFGNKELGALATAVTQVVKNPMLEVMYKGVSLRKFNFSFSLWPRSEQEAIEVQKIIELLRFHQAPEIKSNTGGFFLIPPSEFDISFMYNGKTNPNMDAISTCVLTNISVDYTPKGFHAFESINSIDYPEIGKTGMPVGINLSLSFMETQIITKEYYRGYDSLVNSSNNSFP